MMAFANTVLETSPALGSGEVIKSKPHNTEAFGTFEDGLIQGRFAKYDTGSVENLDGSATPKIVGIVRRKISGEVGVATYRTTGGITDAVAEVHTFGMVSVDVVSGDTPAKYGTVYAVNAAGSGADFGKATTTATGNVDSGWVFWEQLQAGVWLVARKELV